VSHERKKTAIIMPVHKFGMHNPYAHIASYKFRQASGINYLLVPHGIFFASPDSWVGIDNLFYS
jgi:hypothetical protein